MLRFNDIVFGPIKSRRLGVSLGINLLPREGKLCNFDCVYCECGWNADGRTDTVLPTASEIASALQQRLSDMKARGEQLDSITFSGHGEPTLHPEFASVIDKTVELRDRFFPHVQISVLSNATTLDKPEVVAALKKVDSPFLKFDAPSNAQARVINRPQGHYDIDEVVRGMEQFGGDFIMQTMMLGGSEPDFVNDKASLQQWKAVVRRLRPRLVVVYSLDRPAPGSGLVKLSTACMQEMLQDLIDEGLNIKVY